MKHITKHPENLVTTQNQTDRVKNSVVIKMGNPDEFKWTQNCLAQECPQWAIQYDLQAPILTFLSVKGPGVGSVTGGGGRGGGAWRRRAHSLHPAAVRVEQEGFRRMASLGSLL